MFSKFSKYGLNPLNPLNPLNQKLSSPFNKIVSKGFRQRLGGIKEQMSSPPLGYVLLGLGIGGLGYLTWNSSQRRAEMTKSLIASGTTMSKDVSLQRTRDTMLYFAGNITMTAAMTGLMLRSPTILKYSYGWTSLLITLPGTIFCMYKMYTTPPAPQNQTEKHLYWLGFNALMAFSLVPIISVSELLVIRDAFLITSGSFAGLGLMAYNARDDAFLGMTGFLGAGLGGLTAIGLANIFLKSNALFNVWLYGGLALFLAYTLYDMKEIQVRAKRSVYFDPMAQSIGVYLDFVNIFIRLLYILQGRKNKN